MEVVPKWHTGAAAQLSKAAGAPPSDTASLEAPPVLVIEPMQPKWKETTADLLTHVFVEAQQFGTYRTLLRRRIATYLDEQVKLAPKAVLLTATLHLGSGSPAAPQHKQPESNLDLQEHPLPDSTQLDLSEAASSAQHEQALGSDHVNEQQQSIHQSSHGSCESTTQQQGSNHVSQHSVQRESSRSRQSATQQQQYGSMQGAEQLEGDAHFPGDGDNGASTTNAEHISHAPHAQHQPPYIMNDSERGDASSVSGAASWESSSNTQSISSNSSSSSSSSSASGGMDQGKTSTSGDVEVLVGTAEVSFDRITHGRHLYLNPPNKSAYLCNMAVDPQWRKLGVGRALLEAVEQLALAGQENEVYLHMRVKDVPAARLYHASGYKEVGRELGWLSRLLCRDQKMLLAKRLH